MKLQRAIKILILMNWSKEIDPTININIFEEVFKCCFKSKDLSLLHLFVLSNALGKIFVLYGPEPCMIQKETCATIFPFRRRKQSFDNENHNTIALAWSWVNRKQTECPNHFILLHPKNSKNTMVFPFIHPLVSDLTKFSLCCYKNLCKNLYNFLQEVTVYTNPEQRVYPHRLVVNLYFGKNEAPQPTYPRRERKSTKFHDILQKRQRSNSLDSLNLKNDIIQTYYTISESNQYETLESKLELLHTLLENSEANEIFTFDDLKKELGLCHTNVFENVYGLYKKKKEIRCT